MVDIVYPNHPYFESLGGTISTLREYAYDYARDWSATNPSIAYSPELGMQQCLGPLTIESMKNTTI